QARVPSCTWPSIRVAKVRRERAPNRWMSALLSRLEARPSAGTESSMISGWPCLAALALCGALLGWSPRPPRAPGARAGGAPPAQPVVRLFVDEYPQSGIDFVLGHGGRTPLNIQETLGHGAAMLDADGDGRLDLVFLGPDRVALYRNLGDWRFADATAGSGL